MGGFDWSSVVKPNYIVLLPILTLVVWNLCVTVLDLYFKEKRVLVWTSLAGVLLSMVAVWFVATDGAVSTALSSGKPLEVFGRMIVADGFTFFMQAVILGIVALVHIFSIDYVEKYFPKAYLEFYQVVMAATLGMLLMVSSRDLLTIYVGLELSSISSYVLAGMLRKDAKSNEAGMKYFLNGALASAVLLFGLSLVYGATGSTNLVDVASAITGKLAMTDANWMPLLVTGTIFMAGGFAFKISAAPMHFWAPDVYEGSPTPVTGFFSVAPKGAAFAAIVRIFVIGFGASALAERWSLIWAVLAAASMFIGNLTALMQQNVKRMMAYSSIAQAGYILVGVVASGGLKDGKGVAAVLFYILGYAVTNLGIFAVLTHLDQTEGAQTIADLKGLATRSPLYGWFLFLCFISLVGIPPTAGFFGKLWLFQAAVDGGYVWLALCVAFNSAISVGYYYAVVKAMFLEKSEKEAVKAPAPTALAVVISAIGIVLVGLLSQPFISYATEAAAHLIK
ncbi:MAG TPA: NADH-quinone oxidoreductase subunit N [Symbiobacteriaceae bacterium]|nr:NADH-quinone oxidoreductase subunit N [Symbiobacteriaceae bacterium]